MNKPVPPPPKKEEPANPANPANPTKMDEEKPAGNENKMDEEKKWFTLYIVAAIPDIIYSIV